MMRQMIKRMLDVVGASAGLVTFAPVMGMAALGVRISMGRPVFFRQTRPGLHGKPFELLKFRTMKDSFDSGGRPLPDAERMTEFGKFLRRTSIDELPQLWNVLKGEMSLVGPRPLLIQYLALYSDEQSLRHGVKPGITGWAQVRGRNALSWKEKLALDTEYVAKQSILLDARILAMTLLKVVRSDGVSHEGHATMYAFTGDDSESEHGASDELRSS